MKDEEKLEEVADYQKQLEDHMFPNGGQLRDYQAEGVSWLMANWINHRSSILADEMVRLCFVLLSFLVQCRLLTLGSCE